jgi:hypothetical protein
MEGEGPLLSSSSSLTSHLSPSPSILHFPFPPPPSLPPSPILLREVKSEAKGASRLRGDNHIYLHLTTPISPIGVSIGEGEHLSAGFCGGAVGGGAYCLLHVCQCGGRVQHPSSAALALTNAARHTHDQGKAKP